MMLTAGFSLPGFEGRLRAFRTYRPVADATKPTGWKFINDGTRLWPDLDGRPWLAGLARVPADPATRNIYTYIPNGAGGGSVVSFTTSNAATLEPHLRTTGAATTTLINVVRNQSIGAIIGSTPALMDPPSLDPPPDDDYGRSDAPSTYAGQHKDRRAMIFFGANDGMIHAVDARTGYEVWAFIPYNLLPKLRQLPDGQAVDQFDYFVDSSPKIAEVKLNGNWRTLLLIGQGPGGTFYQAFDVTEAGMGVSPEQDGLTAVSALLSQFDTPNESIAFKWAFPNYGNFDPAITQTFTLTDGSPGGKLKLFGDLKATASLAEKTVGFTWSDPAVGPLDANRTTNAVIVGSGYFPPVEDSIANRGVGAPRAGNALYLIDANTGTLVGNTAGGSCPQISSGSGSNKGCVNIGDVSGNGRKNTIQADPSAASDPGNYVVKKAYVGDSDGRYWRFNFDTAGTISTNLMVDTGAPIYASSALLAVGSADLYMFFATGSDTLAASAPGGSGTFRLYGLKDNGSSALTKFAQNLATVTAGSGCTATGERPSTAPSVAGDIVFYTTTTETASDICADFTTKLYGLTYAGGAAYDANGNGKIDNNESPVALTSTGRATAPFIVDQHLFFGTAGKDGADMRVLGDPEDFNNGIGQVGVRILSWREMR
jgi:Tfp pilus tip-associated adhesin PilY1